LGGNPFLGRWRIREMDEWDRDYLDLVVPAFLEFRADGQGAFQFGTVAGFIDYRVVQRGADVAVEWSWEGRSDTDPACGRGWAKIEAGHLAGKIFIHQSDDSGFRAVRVKMRLSRSSAPTGSDSGGAA